METLNHEYYVSLEVAKLLKEAGFDWEVKSYRKGLNGIFETTSISDNFNDGTLTDWISSPTLDVAQRWLREVKKVHIEASPENDEYTEWLVFAYDSNHTAYSGYRTYEEAIEAGIRKCLEMILKKR